VRVAPASTRGRLVLAAAAAAVLMSGALLLRGGAATDLDTAEVVLGEYADVVEIRGEIRPVRSTYVTAPYNAGELQILEIARNGAMVASGDVVARFDAVNLRRTIQEKQSELRGALAELEQGNAQATIAVEERQAAVYKARFDVERSKLALGEIGLVSEIDAERARLELADAEQRLREADAAAESARLNAAADREARMRAVEKIRAELATAERQVSALEVTAPTGGTVNILPNVRSTTPMGVPQEYRAGDRAFPGALILELPDLSSVYLTARIDEADRGQLVQGQSASVRVDAVPDRDYRAEVENISLLARTDFTGGWPPPKQFDLALAIRDPDDRLRPGMSAAARIAVGRLPDVLLVPADAVFYEAGRTVVYRAGRRGFDAVDVEVLRRGRDQAAVRGSVAAGDRVARTRPGAAPEEEEEQP
jgi:HlyD family secretion protein